MPASRILRLARTSRWAMVASGTRKARAISAVSRPPSRRRVSATWAAGASAGWQQVKIRRRRSSRTGPTSWGSSSRGVDEGGLGVAVVAGRLPPQPVDGPVAGGGDDPSARVGRHAGRSATAAAATTNASWTASSARSMSPKRRTRVATARPNSSRNVRSMAPASMVAASVVAGSVVAGSMVAVDGADRAGTGLSRRRPGRDGPRRRPCRRPRPWPPRPGPRRGRRP